jgi:hypothetical protein
MDTWDSGGQDRPRDCLVWRIRSGTVWLRRLTIVGLEHLALGPVAASFVALVGLLEDTRVVSNLIHGLASNGE